MRPGTGLARFPVGFLFTYRGWLSVRASYGYVFSEGQTRTALLSHGVEMMEMEVGMGEVGTGEVGLGAGTAHGCVFDSLFPGVGLLPVGDKVKTVSQMVPKGQGLSAWEKSPGISYGSSAPPPTNPTLGAQDPPELGLLEVVSACDLSVHLVQLPGKGGL